MYRQRFGLTGHPLPKDAAGKTFFDESPGYVGLKKRFAQLAEDPGLGVLSFVESCIGVRALPGRR
jgi:hypothetical protein